MSTTVVVKFQAKADKIDALKEFLSGIQPGVIQAGGKKITMLQDQNDASVFFELEKWNSAEEHQAFIKNAAEAGAFKPFDELLAGPFDVHYLETVKKTKA